MKSLVLPVAAAGAVLVSFAFSQPRDPAQPSGSQACSTGKIASLEPAQEATLIAHVEAADLLLGATDVTHYHLDLEVEPSSGWLKGVNHIYVRSEVDGLSSFRFRLHQQFDLSGVTVDGRRAPFARLDAATVEVSLPEPIDAGESVRVEVAYSGYPPHDGSAVIFRSRAGHPEAATLSQPWYAYLWWPVKDDNRDKATAEIDLTVPSGLRGVSNGRLVDVENVGGGKRRYLWRTEYPTAPYLYFFAVTEFNSFTDTFAWSGGTMPLEFYLYPEQDTPSNRSQCLRTKDMLAAFSARFGVYPFFAEKYGIYQFPYNGGMEHQTSSGQGGFWESLTSHELAHQWWGDLVTCASWSDIWLNEGFATYGEALWEEAKAGPALGQTALTAAMAARKPVNAQGTVYIPEPTSVSRIFSHDLSYLKGAWVLHMLRGVLGDETFFSVLATYRDRYAFSTVTTDAFRTVAEDVSGTSLSWFFDEWVYGYGAPSFTYGFQEVTVAGQRYLELAVAQEQGAGLPPFRTPLQFAVEVGVVEKSFTVWDWAYLQHFLLPVAAPVGWVVLDPDLWVLDTGRRAVPFVPGPPKVVAIATEPGPASDAGETVTLRVTFHQAVVAHGADFSLVGESSGPVGLTFSYEAASNVARLTTLTPLNRDSYTLRVSDSITGAATGQRLDGELGDGGEAALPSGDGLPGGAAVYRFDLAPAPRRRARAGG